MKLRTILKIATATSVVLLCLGFAISFYFRMSATGRAEDFDLYTLVPADSRMVVDTENMVHLMQSINQMNCSKDNHFLYFSRFFVYLKDHINTLLEETPHGLSKQMNKMLISFHEPEGDRNQVFYCRMGAGDYELMEKFIHKYLSSSFPSRFFDYRGKEIRIYPMPDDSFLACYVNTEFLVISYQKKLIEQVIDTQLDGTSLLTDPGFTRVRTDQLMQVPARIYTRMQSVQMGKSSDALRFRTDVGDWTEFTVNLNEDVIYLSGVNYDTDSCATFIGALRGQEPIRGLSGVILPESTLFFSHTSITDLNRLLAFTTRHAYTKATYSNAIMESDAVVADFLNDYADQTLTTCMFHSSDTLSDTACTVISLPVRNRSGLKHALTLLCGNPSSFEGLALPCYTLPRNTVFANLTGITDFSLLTYTCMYKERLLIAPDPVSLREYIYAVENDKVLLEGTSGYETLTASLNESYHFMMMTDMKQILDLPESYVRFIPNLFFWYSKFFRHFIVTAQFSSIGEMMFPTLVLTYHTEQPDTILQDELLPME